MPDKTSENSEEKQTLYYHYAGLTNTGMVRDHNEDAYILPGHTDAQALADRGYLYVLADGMGGHQKGEVASAITIETVMETYYSYEVSVPDDDPVDAIIEALAEAVEQANLDVMDATQGGGTTVVATVLREDILVSMNVGDSRAYLLRDSELDLLSKDHSLVSRLVEMGKITEEEALTHPRRNVLYQALGQGAGVEIYTVDKKLINNDIVVICSDGLWGEVGNERMRTVLLEVQSPLGVAERLIEMANESGGPDNITAIIIQVSDEAPPAAGYGSQNQAPLFLDDDTNPAFIVPEYDKPSTLPEGDN